MAVRVGVLALGAANSASIQAALKRAGAQPLFVDSVDGLARCEALVVPGVSHVGFIIAQMDRRGLRKPLRSVIESGMPTLGICAGYQLLFEASEEAQALPGLGIFGGIVRRLCSPKLPHMGWNFVSPTRASVAPGFAYFAHSFAAPLTEDTAADTVFAGQRFASVSQRGRVTGVQFHPERSGAYGARVLGAFVRGVEEAVPC